MVMMTGLLLLSLVSPGRVAMDDTIRGDPSDILCLLITCPVHSSLSLSRVIQSALSVDSLLAAGGGRGTFYPANQTQEFPRHCPVTMSQ